MIFADKLIQLRKQKGWSQEELAEKMEVTRQSVSKWESAQSVPDIERILQLSDIFDVSLDYLLKNNEDINEQILSADDKPEAYKAIDLTEAKSFIEAKKSTAVPVAIGVFLCVISPICLLILGVLSEINPNQISENMACGAGLIVLSAFIAAAVAVFVLSGSKTSRFEYLEKEILKTDLRTSEVIRKEKEEFRKKLTSYNTIGIVLCVLAAIPLFTGIIISEDDDLLMIICLSATIFTAAIGVAFLVRVNIVQSAFNILLQEGDYSKDKKKKQPIISAVTVVYWLAATAIYLIWSFLSNSWGLTWIIWVAAGVLYPALIPIVDIFIKRK